METTTLFRLMNVEDIENVLKVEEASFATPWSKDIFLSEINNNKYAHYIVAEENGLVIGYCGAWIIIDEAHITNVALLPEYRGRKLGEAMLKQLVDFAKALGAKTMTLEVRVSNIIAQSLYRKLGFNDGGIRKNYYTDNQEDALIMWVNI
ncbi:ribosomal protein S18-alanine N-acetyltransferase [Cytobacillus sp. IB215316]|uniref:ribosomal protein S18-alanine N-acetyltransferase n=1 Tax=Cytobacillus sp. IB215316 TaxID=3097354 RepID=UPI002A13AA71|nr:ribosomal protein S18-alanine N-acetyltransferase [Cytobacillus sp. IB215316]MDX8363304.1 ribosomal protein S18-alanine N-acetyltransferase [Cytobacillus sp. IB215316]